MNIVHAYPPNIDQLDAVFHVRGKPGVLYTYGDTIYVPDGDDVSPELRAHEGVHYSRQTNDPMKIESWWRRYIDDMEFRLEEELVAHRQEFKTFCSRMKDRNLRHRYLLAIASRLAGPLYGNLLTLTEARRRITA